jgi:hypothetical protein
MSTTATQPPTTLDVSNRPRTPFTTLIRVELRTTYETRAGAWLVGFTALLAAAVLGVGLIVVLGQGRAS